MKFDEWFNQQEGYGTRAERFYEDLEWNDHEKIKDWLLAAYNEGLREGLATPSVNPMPVIPTWPNMPAPWQQPSQQPMTCSKCGMNLNGVMGYVCSDMQCPTFARVWSGTLKGGIANVQSYNISNVYGLKSDEGYNG